MRKKGRKTLEISCCRLFRFDVRFVAINFFTILGWQECNSLNAPLTNLTGSPSFQMISDLSSQFDDFSTPKLVKQMIEKSLMSELQKQMCGVTVSIPPLRLFSSYLFGIFLYFRRKVSLWKIYSARGFSRQSIKWKNFDIIPNINLLPRAFIAQVLHCALFCKVLVQKSRE